MNRNIKMCIDQSLSMNPHKHKTIEGIYNFIKNEKNYLIANQSHTWLNTVFFSNTTDTLYDCVYLNSFEYTLSDISASYVPNGCTRLYSTIYEELPSHIKKSRELIEITQSPIEVIFVIFTDGEDNLSMGVTKTDVFSVVKNAIDQGVKCIFMASNQDAIKTGTEMGFNSCDCYTIGNQSSDISDAFESLSSVLNNMRL